MTADKLLKLIELSKEEGFLVGINGKSLKDGRRLSCGFTDELLEICGSIDVTNITIVPPATIRLYAGKSKSKPKAKAKPFGAKDTLNITEDNDANT